LTATGSRRLGLASPRPADCAGLFAAHHALKRRAAEIRAEHWPGDLIYSTENTSATLISPRQYRQYRFDPIREYGEIITGSGRIHVLHMCGHLRTLLPMLNELPAQVFEAFTAPTRGNTTRCDGRTHCPGKCLVGGTQATWWTEPAESIIARLDAALGEFPHHRGLVVTSAAVMPPLCKPDVIQTVCNWVKAYPARW
jgi:hypothetical protein